MMNFKTLKSYKWALAACVMLGLTLLLYSATSASSAQFEGKVHKIKKSGVSLLDGDIVFQSTSSRQCEAVKQVTKSEYSHCGIVFIEGGEYYVYEAVQPVKRTKLSQWIKQGDAGEYVAMRLKDREAISEEEVANMKAICAGFLGKNYDITFEWSDDQIYCSELVWKVYQRATNIEVGELQKLGDLDLTSPLAKEILNERYGKKIPLEETVISPASIMNSKLLMVVN
jgi:Permuted papain-like amidase enzyme, YaeF/YiiX, C92 family